MESTSTITTRDLAGLDTAAVEALLVTIRRAGDSIPGAVLSAAAGIIGCSEGHLRRRVGKAAPIPAVPHAAFVFDATLLARLDADFAGNLKGLWRALVAEAHPGVPADYQALRRRYLRAVEPADAAQARVRAVRRAKLERDLAAACARAVALRAELATLA